MQVKERVTVDGLSMMNLKSWEEDFTCVEKE